MLKRLTQLPQFAHIEQPAKNRTDGYKVAEKDVYKANPLDGPATFSKYDGKGPLVVRVFSFSFRKAFLKTLLVMVAVMCSIVVALTIPVVTNLIRR